MQYSFITTPTFSLLSPVLISDFRRAVVRSSLFWGGRQRRLVDSCRRFVTTYHFHFERVQQSENVDRYTNLGDFCSTVKPSGYSFVQDHFSPLHMLLFGFWSYTAGWFISCPLTVLSFLTENLSVHVPFFLFHLCAIRSNWHIFGFTQREWQEVAWRVEPQTVQSCLSYGTQQT